MSAGRPSAGAGREGAAAGRFSFGHTGKGLGANLFVRGDVLVGWGELWGPASSIDGRLVVTCPPDGRCAKHTWLSDVVQVNPRQSVRFRGNHLSFHRVVDSGRGEVWLVADRKQGGRVITGWTRQTTHFPGYGPTDTGKVSFTTRLWSASSGVAWSGKTVDGRPLTVEVGYTLEPGSIVNGRRAMRPSYTVKLPAVSRPLACRAGDGTSATVDVSLPAVSGELVPQLQVASALYPTGRRLGTSPGVPLRASATTAAGVKVTAELAVDALRWQGSGLVATGRLSYEGTQATETGVSTCEKAARRFTIRPQ